MTLRRALVTAGFFSTILFQTFSFAEPPKSTTANLRRVDLEHFTLWSQRELSAADVFETRQNLQNVRREVGRAFGGYFPNRKFDVMLTDSEMFRSTTGLPEHVTGYFDGTIHLPVPSAGGSSRLKAILYHEYTHALVWLASNGRCPSWIHEGLAVDQEERVDSILKLDAKQLVRGRGLRWRLDDLDQRIDPRVNDPTAARAAYDEAYAVIRHLRSNRRPADFLRWLKSMGRSGSWQNATLEVFKTTPEKIEQATAASL